MNWVKTIEDAMEYIEGNITEDLTVGRIQIIMRKFGFR